MSRMQDLGIALKDFYPTLMNLTYYTGNSGGFYFYLKLIIPLNYENKCNILMPKSKSPQNGDM